MSISNTLGQGLANFSIKGQRANIPGVPGHTVCSNYSALPLRHRSSHKATKMNESGWGLIRLYLRKQAAGQIQVTGQFTNPSSRLQFLTFVFK